MTAQPTSDLHEVFVNWMEGRYGPLLHLRVDADPRPESLRVGRFNRVYPGKLYAAFQQECVRQLAGPKVTELRLDGPLVVAMEFVIQRPKTTKREWPTGDVDNYLKGPMDALTKIGAWHDDDQVQVAYPTKRYARSGEQPGVNIVIGRLK